VRTEKKNEFAIARLGY